MRISGKAFLYAAVAALLSLTVTATLASCGKQAETELQTAGLTAL